MSRRQKRRAKVTAVDVPPADFGDESVFVVAVHKSGGQFCAIEARIPMNVLAQYVTEVHDSEYLLHSMPQAIGALEREAERALESSEGT